MSTVDSFDFASHANERLQFTIFLGIALNALIIFGVGSSMDVGDKFAPTLNITLATHKSNEEPERADFIAQHNQEASGTEKDIHELTTTKMADIADVHIREVSPEAETRARVLQENDLQVVDASSAQRKYSQAKADNFEKTEKEMPGEEVDVEQSDPEIASLRAKLDRLKQELAKQPRIRRLTSVSTKSSFEAAYLNNWTLKIEGVGNRHFPEQALRDGIFGALRMSVLLRADGSVEDIEILQSSGHHMLDEAALQIVKLSSPFPRFPKEITRNTDKLEIIRTWKFEITGLSTSN